MALALVALTALADETLGQTRPTPAAARERDEIETDRDSFTNLAAMFRY